MKSEKIKKLVLNKKTIAHLNDGAMINVKGGTVGVSIVAYCQYTELVGCDTLTSCAISCFASCDVICEADQ